MLAVWLTVKEVLAMYPGKIGKTKLYRMAENGKLRSSKLGKLLIDTESIDAYIAAHVKEAVPLSKKPPPKPVRFKHFSTD